MLYLMSLCSGVLELQLLSPGVLEPVLPNKRSHRKEKPLLSEVSTDLSLPKSKDQLSGPILLGLYQPSGNTLC